MVIKKTAYIFLRLWLVKERPTFYVELEIEFLFKNRIYHLHTVWDYERKWKKTKYVEDATYTLYRSTSSLYILISRFLSFPPNTCQQGVS
jgi:hypothetical protein